MKKKLVRITVPAWGLAGCGKKIKPKTKPVSTIFEGLVSSAGVQPGPPAGFMMTLESSGSFDGAKVRYLVGKRVRVFIEEVAK